MLAIYQTYADKLNYDGIRQNDAKRELSLYDKYVKGVSPQDKSDLVADMIKEMNAAGVVFEAASYEKVVGDISYPSHLAKLRISNLTEEELADAKQTFHDCYYETYPLWEDFIATDINGKEYVIKDERRNFFTDADDPGQSLSFPFSLLDIVVPVLEEKYEGISIETREDFVTKLTTNPLDGGRIDFLDISDGTASGDVNLDGKIDLTDTIMIKKYEAGAVTLAEEQKANADLDGNGTVDSNDALQLLRFLLRLEEAIG